MVLVEKEKKGHSYSSTRHPTLSEEKKAKMKSFTKEYSHKLLKRLKDKGKLRRIPSTSVMSNGSSSTPHALSTPNGAPPATPNGSSSEPRHDDLLDEMFGEEDVDGDGEVDLEVDEGMYPSPPDIATPDGEVFVSAAIERKAVGIEGFGETPGRTPSSVEGS